MEIRDPVPQMIIPVPQGRKTVSLVMDSVEAIEAAIESLDIAKTAMLGAQAAIAAARADEQERDAEDEIAEDDAWRLTPAGLAAANAADHTAAELCSFHGGSGAYPAGGCTLCEQEEAILDAGDDDENGPMDDEAELRRADAIRAGQPDPDAAHAEPEPPLEAADIAAAKLPDPYRLWANGEPPGLAAPDLDGGLLFPAGCDPDALCRCGHDAADHHLNPVTGERVYCNACRDVGACDGFSPAARMLALVPQAATP